MTKTKLCLGLLVLLLPVLAFAQDQSKYYKIYDVKKKQVINIDDIISDLNHADVLFFGEEHNDSIGHYLETALLKKLSDKYPGKVALSLEMFHTDVQPVVDEYLNGNISEKNFIKEARAWNNYKDYRPMIELAKTTGLPVIAANAATRYSNMVTRYGLESLARLPEASKKFLGPLPVDTAAGRYYDKFKETLGGHSMGDMKIYQTQNFWDATMAWSIAKYARAHPKHKIFQVNGRFHSDEHLGALAQLKKYAQGLKILNISSFSADDFSSPDWKKYEILGDYVIVTDPAVKRSF